MRFNTLFFIIFISVLGTCLGYKLRRDISKVRHYCKEICTQCGGEAALSRDVCVCNIEDAEGQDVSHCLERARNKFEFLGIKLEADNRPVNKRSIYKPYHPSHSDDQGAYLHMEPDQERRALFKRDSVVRGTYNGVSPRQKAIQEGDPSGTDAKLRSKRSFNDNDNRFDISRFTDLFHYNYPIRPPSNFKILLGSSKQPDLDRGLYYDMMVPQGRGNDEDYTEDGSNSSASGDYDDDKTALRDELNLRRWDTNNYDQIPSLDMTHPDDSSAKEFNSFWDTVLLEVLNPNHYIPSNFADNIMFM